MNDKYYPCIIHDKVFKREEGIGEYVPAPWKANFMQFGTNIVYPDGLSPVTVTLALVIDTEGFVKWVDPAKIQLIKNARDRRHIDPGTTATPNNQEGGANAPTT
jgi:hypothetical protein